MRQSKITTVTVFRHRMTVPALAAIAAVADRAAGEYFGAYAANGPSPDSPAYVAIDDVDVPRSVVDRVRRAVSDKYYGRRAK
jgi:hypothetical protein